MIPQAEVGEEKQRGVGFPGHQKVRTARERHRAMGYKNHSAGCLQCENANANNPLTRWRRKGTAVPPAEPAPHLPGRSLPPRNPCVPPGDAEGNKSYEIEGMASSCVYMDSPLLNTQFFNHNAFAMESKHDKDFIPDLLSTQSGALKYHWDWFWRRQ